MPESVVHHLALWASDVERLARFYERALGLRRQGRHLDEQGQLRAIWLALDSHTPPRSMLMIEKSHAQSVGSHVETGPNRGWFLVAFRVAVAERTTWEERIEAAGASIERRSQFSSYARDPEGNRFAISCHPLRTFASAPSDDADPP